MVHWVDQALAVGPTGTEMLLVGLLNFRLAQPHKRQKEYFVTAIANKGLENQMLYFILQR